MTTLENAPDSSDRIQVLVGSDLLYLGLVAGVIPTATQGGSGLVARVVHRAVAGCAVAVPRSSVALEFAVADWERAQRSGLAAIHDVRRFIFGDDKQRDHLQSTMTPELGFPAFQLPFESATEVARQGPGAGDAASEEPRDAASFVNMRLGTHAAVTLALLEQMKQRGAKRLNALGAASFTDGVALDHRLVVGLLSAIAGADRTTTEVALEWASTQSTSEDDPKKRLQELVSRLGHCSEVTTKLDRFKSTTEDIMDGEVLADPKLLLDDGNVLLRALAVLFRVAEMNIATVGEFLDAEEKSQQVGLRVRATATCLAAAATGGFKSLHAPFKSEIDLYAIGSCLSAGQQERVTLRRKAGDEGFEVLLDGNSLDYFSDRATSPVRDCRDVSPLIELLKMRAREAGYDFRDYEDPVPIDASTESPGHSLQKYLIDGDIVVEFDPANQKQALMRIDCNCEMKRRKKLPPVFFERASAVRKGGELVCRGQRVSLYRDHHGTDLNTDELRGHVESLRGGHALIMRIWADVKSAGTLDKASARIKLNDEDPNVQRVPKSQE